MKHMRWRDSYVHGVFTGGRGTLIIEDDLRKHPKAADDILNHKTEHIMTDFECEVYELELEKMQKAEDKLKAEQLIAHNKAEKEKADANAKARREAGLPPVIVEIEKAGGDK